MIYLDHDATSPVLPDVREAMLPWLGVPCNPSSVHAAGRAAAAAVERARAEVAALVGADPAGVVFTSGATEANHLFLRGALTARRGRVVVSPLEHPSTRGAVDGLAQHGVAVTRMDVASDGVVIVPRSLPDDTAVVSLIAVSHETGIVQPVAAARAAADAVGAWLHVDATQAVGRLGLDGRADGLVLSGHKLGGPGGIGALVLADGSAFPALFPGSQERGRRGGTVNTAGVVGFGVAAAHARVGAEQRVARWTALRSRLEAALRALGGEVIGAGVARVANTTAVVFPGLRGEVLVAALDLHGVAVSAGAACASGSQEPSPTLAAMGHPEPAGLVRISLGPHTDDADVDGLLAVLPAVLRGARAAAAWTDDLR